MQYPALAIDPRGFTQILDDDSYWASIPIGFINIYKKRQSTLVFYAADRSQWKLDSIQPLDSLSVLRRLFQPLHRVRASVELQSNGAYSVDQLRDALRSAINADDDILCQHHSREQILAWLESAKTDARIFNLYRWITKDFTRGARPPTDSKPTRGKHLTRRSTPTPRKRGAG